jgi:hypothetical protein
LVNFSIAFTGFDEQDPMVAIGKLRLGDADEYFESVLGFWAADDYERSWSACLRRLLAGESISCLATSITNPPTANFVEVWPLYREGNDVYVQNSLIFLDQLSHEFNTDAPWESVSPRETVDEDGQVISEWKVNLTDIREFLRTTL